MRKIIAIFTTVLVVVFMVYILPTFSYSRMFFISKYNPNARELAIIQYVYDKMYLPTKLSLWMVVVMYVLFLVLYFTRKETKPK